MNIAVNSGYFKKIYGSDNVRNDLEAALICKKGGFDILDCSPKFFEQDDWQRKADDLAESFAKEGITVEQSHAPFNRYIREDEQIFKEKLRRSFIIASKLGAKRIVIHADEYVPKDGIYRSEDACRFAYEFFAPFVELAEKLGIGVAVENLFEDRKKDDRERCTSTVDEVLKIIELFNTPSVTCCWDFGHAAVAFGDNMLDELKKAAKYVTCTHVHDNYFFSDMHLPIFLGKIDWGAQIKYLKEINYPGAFTFEFVYGVLPDDAIYDFLKFQYNSARFLVNQ